MKQGYYIKISLRTIDTYRSASYFYRERIVIKVFLPFYSEKHSPYSTFLLVKYRNRFWHQLLIPAIDMIIHSYLVFLLSKRLSRW